MNSNFVSKGSTFFSVLVTMISSSAAQADQQNDDPLHRVNNTYAEYNSPIIGNGEIVTTIGPAGYHNGYCPENERVNRTVFWAGRRMKDANNATIRIPRVPPEELIGATKPLIRFGRLSRTLTINGRESKDANWEQELVVETGSVRSRLDHDGMIEETYSTVCLNSNVLIFITTFTNKTPEAANLEFIIDYGFGDAVGELPKGTRLNIRRPYPTDITFGNIEGKRSEEEDLDQRPPHLLESLSVQYEFEEHLGEVHLGRYPMSLVRQTDQGGQFIFNRELPEGESTEIWIWMSVSDRLKYTHFPDFEETKRLLSNSQQAWKDFWQRSDLETHNREIDAVRKSCLYTLRVNSSPWSLPPGYLSTLWEGRTFHDEFYPFLGLISSNYPELARKIPAYRLLTLGKAMERSAGNGAFYAWEATEKGEESAPYGHWVDERFIHGQIAEHAWKYFLYTRDTSSLRAFYPVIKGCAQWMIHDVVRKDDDGKLSTRMVADVNEDVTSARNSIFLLSSLIRNLEVAVSASEILKADTMLRRAWQALIPEAKKILPVDRQTNSYLYAATTSSKTGLGNLGPIFPFAIDITSELANNTLDRVVQNFLREKSNQPAEELVFSNNWIWASSNLASACFYQGKTDYGYRILVRVPSSLRAFLAPNEHYNPEYGAFLPWLTSGAGAFVYALNAMVVQVINDEPPSLLPAVPDQFRDLTFSNLLVSDDISVSGNFRKGELKNLTLHCGIEREFPFYLPEKYRKVVQGNTNLTRKKNASKPGFDLYVISTHPGDNILVSQQ